MANTIKNIFFIILFNVFLITNVFSEDININKEIISDVKKEIKIENIKINQIEELLKKDFDNNTNLLDIINILIENRTVFNINNNLTEDNKNLLDIQKEKIKDLIFNSIQNNKINLFTSSKVLEIEKNIQKLNEKININKNFNYKFAVTRDTITKLTLKNQLYLNTFLKDFILNKKNFSKKEKLIEIIENFESLLNKNTILINNQFKELDIKENQSNQILLYRKDNYKNYLININVYNIIVNNIKSNVNTLLNKNIFEEIFNINLLQEKINNINYVENTINPYLIYFIKVDFGKLVLAITVFFSILLLNFILLPILVNLTDKYFNKGDDNKNKFKKYIFNNLKSPLKIFLFLFGLFQFFSIINNGQFNFEFIKNIISSANFFVVGWLIINLATDGLEIFSENLFQKYPSVRKEILLFLNNILKVFIFIAVILFSLRQFGINIWTFVGGLGVLGLGVSLASKDMFSNFLGGFNIIFSRTFENGDWIKTDEIEGTVVEVGMRTTKIRTFDNALGIIPNNYLSNTSLLNWKRKIGRRIKMDITLTYESGMENIKNLKLDILNMLKNHPDIATERDVYKGKNKSSKLIKLEDNLGIKKTLFVHIDKYNNSSIDIEVYCFSKNPDWGEWKNVKEDVIIKISELVYKNNCEFAYPTNVTHLKGIENKK